MPGWTAVLLWWGAFAVSHSVPCASPIREQLVSRLGLRGFRAAYSAVSLVVFALLVRSYWRAIHTGPELWHLRSVPGVSALAVLLSTVAVIAALAGFLRPSPASFRAGGGPPRAVGLLRVTRHPVFAAFGLWALAHLLVNGFLADVVFFGGFALYSVVGAAHQDVRKRKDPALQEFFAKTSFLPFWAIVSGRNRWARDELPWWTVPAGVVAAAIIYHLHPAG